MREIKFRVWDKIDNIMIYEKNYISEKYGPNGYWMQYTGLKDKKGKDIYEGDILLGKFILDEVHDYIYLSLSEKEKEEQSKIFFVEDIFYLYANNIPNNIEILGNIYENPEFIIKK